MTRELLGRSDILGRQVRIDPPRSLTDGTYTKIKEALTAGDWDAAKRLIDFFDEARGHAVVGPPTYPNDGKAVCRWRLYRQVEDVPAAVYERLGLAKPPAGAALGSRGIAETPAASKP